MTYILSSPYAIAQFATALISILVAVLMWNRRSVRGGLVLFMLFVAISEWALASGMEAAAVNQDLKVFWAKISYLGVQTSPVLVLVFAIQYSGKRRKLSPLRTSLLFVIPLLVIVLAITNDLHNLVWISFSPGPQGSNSLIYHHGPFFWLGIAYIFTMVSFATTILILSAVQSQKLYRFQFIIILVASLLPWIGSVLYLFDLSPYPGLDTTSISFLFTGILLMIGVTTGSLMNYIPIAHELLFKNINDGVLVFDRDFRLIDMNPCAEEQLFMKFNQLIGKDLNELAEFLPLKQKHFNLKKNSRLEIISPQDDKTWFNASISPLYNHGDFMGWVTIVEDITKRKEAENKIQLMNQRLKRQLNANRELQDQLREQANRDALTGVFNRGYMAETLVREIYRAERKNYPISVIMLDVDHFKKINDNFGHKTGDDVVIQLGKMLQEQSRKADCVSRFGGDEFIMVMPEMNAVDAFQRGEVWRSKFKALKVPGLDPKFKITISVGIATYPSHGSNYDDLLDAVDQALYQAKQSGRDCTRQAGS